MNIHNVEGLLAAHLSPVEQHQVAVGGYPYQPYSPPDHAMNYASYSAPAPASRAYEDNRRFLPRDARANYGGGERMEHHSETYLPGRIPNSRLEMPGPPTLPSLLPTSPTSSRMPLRLDTARERTSNVRSPTQGDVLSPLSPAESMRSPSTATKSPTIKSEPGSATTPQGLSRREPSLVVIACRQW